MFKPLQSSIFCREFFCLQIGVRYMSFVTLAHSIVSLPFGFSAINSMFFSYFSLLSNLQPPMGRTTFYLGMHDSRERSYPIQLGEERLDLECGKRLVITIVVGRSHYAHKERRLRRATTLGGVRQRGAL